LSNAASTATGPSCAATEGELLANLLNARNVRSAVVTFSDSDYGREAAAAFDAIYRGVHRRTITLSLEHELEKNDYSAEVAALATAGGDILVIFGDFATSAEDIIAQSVLSGAYDDFALSSTAYSPSLAQLIGPDYTAVGFRPLDLTFGPVGLIRSYTIVNTVMTDGPLVAGPGVFLPNIVSGNLADNTLAGTGRLDLILGEDGNDRLSGGRGNDYLYGGSGVDSLFGGSGYDAISGSVGEDIIFGGVGNDAIHGDDDNDRLSGESGVDTLFGGAGSDTLNGGHNRDVLYGGSGDDQLTGGSGIDTFVFRAGSGNDRITDFLNGRGDRLQLDDNLWQSSLSVEQVVAQFGSVSSGGVSLVFANGDHLRIDRFTDLASLANYIEII
jgi:Ca2+-binding RTX toxin-like protein